MPADYKGRGDGREKRPLPGFVWLLAGLSIGLFVALIVYLDKQPEVTANFGAAVKKELEKIKQHSSSTTTKSTSNGNKQYVLQAGSFNNKTDAEKLKASLALLGFEAHIQSVTVNGTAWHRVRTGPYTHSNDLYDKIDQLQQNGIKAMPMELKPE